jgi:hypothetical protein
MIQSIKVDANNSTHIFSFITEVAVVAISNGDFLPSRSSVVHFGIIVANILFKLLATFGHI